MAVIELGAWAPDQPDGVAVQTAVNVVPGAVGYRAFPSAAPATDPLPAPIQAVFAAADPASTATIIAATSEKLYKQSVSSWIDITHADGLSPTVETDKWEMIIWGNRVIATNFRSSLIYYELDGGIGNKFKTLPGSPPNARHIAAVRDFVVIANIVDSADGPRPNRVQWSGIADSEYWGLSAEKQADFQDLYDSGAIQALVGGEYGVLFCDKAIYRMTYVGSPLVFQFDRVETDRGTFAPNSVVPSGNLIYYYGLDGFYVFDGVKSNPIGGETIDQWFANKVDARWLDKIEAAVDPARGIIMWAFPSKSSGTGVLDTAIIYNYRVQRWSMAEINVTTLARTITTGYTLEQLDQISTSVDTLPASLDSRLWAGGLPMFSAATPDNRLAHFTGPAQTAIVETPEQQIGGELRAWVQRVRPMVDGGDITVQIGTRRRMTDPVEWTAPIPLNQAGEAPARSNSRFHRFRLNISGAWREALGVDVVAVAEGSR
jgi:hypothetical protein